MTEPVFGPDGLIPVVTQAGSDGAVLMLAYADRAALELTLSTGEAHYYSRSRQELWRKGATSGNTQRVTEVRVDCDGDALLYVVDERGPACHTGNRSCFYRDLARTGSSRLANAAGPDAQVSADLGAVLSELERTIVDRLAELPEGSYVRRLHERGVGYVAQKVVEEAGEAIVAALQQDDEALVGEAADLLFHLCVLLAERGVGLERIAGKLSGRRKG